MTTENMDDDLRWAMAVQGRLHEIIVNSGAGRYRVASHMMCSRQYISLLHAKRNANFTILRLVRLCDSIRRAAESVKGPAPSMVVSFVSPGVPLNAGHLKVLTESMRDHYHHIDLVRGQFAKAMDVTGLNPGVVSSRSGVPVRTVESMMVDIWDPPVLSWRMAGRAVGLEFQLLLDGCPVLV